MLGPHLYDTASCKARFRQHTHDCESSANAKPDVTRCLKDELESEIAFRSIEGYGSGYVDVKADNLGGSRGVLGHCRSSVWEVWSRMMKKCGRDFKNLGARPHSEDRKSTRLNSSHSSIS